jgi:hypothetical protein
MSEEQKTPEKTYPATLTVNSERQAELLYDALKAYGGNVWGLSDEEQEMLSELEQQAWKLC